MQLVREQYHPKQKKRHGHFLHARPSPLFKVSAKRRKQETTAIGIFEDFGNETNLILNLL